MSFKDDRLPSLPSRQRTLAPLRTRLLFRGKSNLGRRGGFSLHPARTHHSQLPGQHGREFLVVHQQRGLHAVFVLELHVGEALADAGFLVADHSDRFDGAAFAERAPEAFFGVGGLFRRGASLLRAFFAVLRFGLGLFVDEAEVADEDAAFVFDWEGFREPVDSKVPVEDDRAVQLLGDVFGGGFGGEDGVGVGAGRGRVHEFLLGECSAFRDGTCKGC